MSNAGCRYLHPFTTALEQLPGQYPSWIVQNPSLCVPEPIEEDSYVFVDNPAALADMAAHLSTVREFAVDLEHSSRYVYSVNGCSWTERLVKAVQNSNHVHAGPFKVSHVSCKCQRDLMTTLWTL